jgi:uncharacterized protein
MEKVFIKNRRGQQLAVVVHKTPEPNSDAFILAHSFKGDKDYDKTLALLAPELSNLGCTVFLFDFFGSGESDGDFENATVRSEIEDLEDMIKYVRGEGYHVKGLVGLSLGGIVSLYALDKEVESLVLWSPPLNLKVLHEHYKLQFGDEEFLPHTRRYTGEPINIGRKMWEEFNTLDVQSKLPSIACPTLAIFGNEDELFDAEKMNSIFNKIDVPKKELIVITGGDHDFLKPDAKKEILQKTIDWIQKLPKS